MYNKKRTKKSGILFEKCATTSDKGKEASFSPFTSIFFLSNNRIVVTWYVYDKGKPIWLIGEGTHDGYKATLEASIAENGLFPPNFNSSDVKINNWGQFELEFYNCNKGFLSGTQ